MLLQTRVMPCLLLKDRGLVKTIKFKKPEYVGDPINAVKIFNDKEVDEMVFLDINATLNGSKPQFEYITQIAGECFMPLAYGGGIRTIDEIREILFIGVEKVVLNTIAVENPVFVREAADTVGSQSIVVSIDVKKNLFGKYVVYTHGARQKTTLSPLEHAINMEKMGAGEILINSIDQDGTMSGYDIDLIKIVSNALSIPVVACGGAGSVTDFEKAVKQGGADAVAAGSMFVFHGKHRAVLINFPARDLLKKHLP